jgi:ABC transporter with metal-binding/Fe-S-binding domain ATP-binding protein
LRLAALYSGGKDSTFSIFKAKQAGHDIAFLISMRPSSDESLLFHYPNTWLTDLLANAMHIPLASFKLDKASKDAEVQALEKAIISAKSTYGIDGIVHGAISSNFQNQLIKTICDNNGLEMIAPIWNIQVDAYMEELLSERFHVIFVSVSAMGLESCWLGKTLDRSSLATLSSLSRKFGFNLAFEGGEAETLVVDCPLFTKQRISINKARVHWDGQRGIFEILEASLICKK